MYKYISLPILVFYILNFFFFSFTVWLEGKRNSNNTTKVSF